MGSGTGDGQIRCNIKMPEFVDPQHCHPIGRRDRCWIEGNVARVEDRCLYM